LCKRARKAWNHRLTKPEAYKNAIKEYTIALRSKKRSSWKDFCGEVDGIQPSAILHRILHAYLKEKSTETALHDLVYKIDGSLAQKEFALGVFLDVEGAFDNTSFESMDDAASDHRVCSTINR
jgi:hypothetical protein